MAVFHVCDRCEALEERVFIDTWTGLEVCCECLHKVVHHVTNSPRTEGDNLTKLLDELA